MAGMISKRWLINYLLIVLIIVFTYIGNLYQVKPGYQAINSISNLKPQDIKTLAIQTADDNIILKKTATSWQIESPVKWPANNIMVERVLTFATTEIKSSLPADEIDLATLGLQFPSAVLTLDDSRFLFGATNNIGGRRYVKTGSTIYLVEDIHLPLFSQGLTGLIDRRLLPRSLALQTLRFGKFNLSKTNSGGWQNEGETFQADLLDSLIGNWQTLEASIIKPYQKSDIPRLKITAGLSDGSEIEFFLMDISPELIIARPDLGLQYHFSESLYYGLLEIAPK